MTLNSISYCSSHLITTFLLDNLVMDQSRTLDLFLQLASASSNSITTAVTRNGNEASLTDSSTKFSRTRTQSSSELQSSSLYECLNRERRPDLIHQKIPGAHVSEAWKAHIKNDGGRDFAVSLGKTEENRTNSFQGPRIEHQQSLTSTGGSFLEALLKQQRQQPPDSIQGLKTEQFPSFRTSSSITTLQGSDALVGNLLASIRGSADEQSGIQQLKNEELEIERSQEFQGSPLSASQSMGSSKSIDLKPDDAGWLSAEDGYQWHKYGQKTLMEGGLMRAYYRCKHRATTGCMAQKTVDKEPLRAQGGSEALGESRKVNQGREAMRLRRIRYQKSHNHSPPSATSAALPSSPPGSLPLADGGTGTGAPPLASPSTSSSAAALTESLVLETGGASATAPPVASWGRGEGRLYVGASPLPPPPSSSPGISLSALLQKHSGPVAKAEEGSEKASRPSAQGEEEKSLWGLLGRQLQRGNSVPGMGGISSYSPHSESLPEPCGPPAKVPRLGGGEEGWSFFHQQQHRSLRELQSPKSRAAIGWSREEGGGGSGGGMGLNLGLALTSQDQLMMNRHLSIAEAERRDLRARVSNTSVVDLLRVSSHLDALQGSSVHVLGQWASQIGREEENQDRKLDLSLRLGFPKEG